MDELFHFLVTDPMARIAIVVILWVIIIAIILLVISVVISIFQGRSLKFWQISLGGRTNKKNKKKLDDSELDSVETDGPLVGLPQTEEELEEIIFSVWEEATEAESNRFWNILALLRHIYVFDNTVLLYLSNSPKSPYEIWIAERKHNTKAFKNIEKSIRIAMKVISDVTRGDDTYSNRIASIALRNTDGYLYIVMRDDLFPEDEKKKKFLMSASSNEAGIAGQVAFYNKAMRIANVLDESSFIKFHNTPKYKSLLCVPIQVNDYIFGTFSIDSTAEYAYTQEEEELANMFANSIATSLITLMLRYTKQS
jgi:hypothetical protein